MKFTFDRKPGFMEQVADQKGNAFKFAGIVALTRTAVKVKAAEVKVMRQVFDRPTPYALNGLQVRPATKQLPEAKVDFKEFGSVPAGRYLEPEVDGGSRRQKSSERKVGGYLIPGKSLVLNAYGNVPGSVFVKILSQLKLQSDSTQNASGSRRSKSKRKREAFYLDRKNGVIMKRTRTPAVRDADGKVVQPRVDDLQPMFVISNRAPVYRTRFPFYETAKRISNEVFEAEFEKAFAQATR